MSTATVARWSRSRKTNSAPSRVSTSPQRGFVPIFWRCEASSPRCGGILSPGCAEPAAETEAARPADPAEPDSASSPPSAAAPHAPVRLRGAGCRRPRAALFAAGAYSWRSGLAPRFCVLRGPRNMRWAIRVDCRREPERPGGRTIRRWCLSTDPADPTCRICRRLLTAPTSPTNSSPVAAGSVRISHPDVLDANVRRGDDHDLRAASSPRRRRRRGSRSCRRSSTWRPSVDVVARLSNSLGVELVKAEALRAIRERPSNPNAADLAMQADAKSSLPATKANLNDSVALAGEAALACRRGRPDRFGERGGAMLDRWRDTQQAILRAPRISMPHWPYGPRSGLLCAAPFVSRRQ